MKIAIYGICKNEAKFAKRFAESIVNAEQQPDGVYITDTGSTDGTQEILRSYGFNVYDEIVDPWRFDTARNISLSKVPDDIDVVVCPDLDDIMYPKWREIIERNWINGAKCLNYPYINNWEDDDKTPQITVWGFKVHNPKLFYWKYPIHEVLFRKDLTDDTGKYVITEQIMEHRPEVKEERKTRIKLFENYLDEYKDDVLFIHNYGRELIFEKNYKKAIEVLKHFLNITQFYLLKEKDLEIATAQIRSQACRFIAECLVNLEEKDNNNIVSWYIKSVSESPYQREPWVYLANAWYGIRDGYSAMAAIEKAFILNDKRHSLQVEDRCWDERVQELYQDIKKLFDEEISYNNNIEGWMTPLELKALRNTAIKMDSIVEIGSWKGRSTHALLSTCKGKVYAIDHFKGTLSDGEAHKEAFNNPNSIYKQFRKNLKDFKNLKVLKMGSEKAAKKFKDYSVDMVFIDGDHSYEAVKRDIELWNLKARKMICGHDYNFPEVKKAVDERFENVKVLGSIWYYNKEKINE